MSYSGIICSAGLPLEVMLSAALPPNTGPLETVPSSTFPSGVLRSSVSHQMSLILRSVTIAMRRESLNLLVLDEGTRRLAIE